MIDYTPAQAVSKCRFSYSTLLSEFRCLYPPMSSTKTPAAGPHRRAACESVAEMHSMAQYKTKKPPMPCGLCLSPGHRVYGPYVGVNGVNAGHFYAIVSNLLSVVNIISLTLLLFRFQRAETRSSSPTPLHLLRCNRFRMPC